VASPIPLERFWWELQLCFRPHLNWRSAQEVMGLQSHKSPNFENFETPNLGVLGQNDNWVHAPWPSTKNTIKGKVWLPPNPGRGESCGSVFACGSSMHQKCSNYALTNLLFGLFKFVWIIDPLITRPSPHLRALTQPLYPWSVISQEMYLNSLSFCCFHLWTQSWVHHRVWGCVIGSHWEISPWCIISCVFLMIYLRI